MTMKDSTASFVVAAILAVMRVTVPRVPLGLSGPSIGQLHAACSSGIGQLAQAFSSQSASDCNTAGLAWDALNLVMAAAVVSVITAVVLVARGKLFFPRIETGR